MSTPLGSPLPLLCALADAPPLLWGEPGIGKSSAVGSWCDAHGWHLETLILSIREPSDVCGLPVLDGDRTRLATPNYAARIQERDDQGVPSVLFFDELTTARPDVQGAALQVVLDRRVGDTRLPSSTILIAAANPPSLAAEGYMLTAPLANRFAHFDVLPSLDDWCAGIVGGFSAADAVAIDDDWRSTVPVWHARVAGFVRHRPELLHKVPNTVAARSAAWPSPRSWEMLARAAAVVHPVRPDLVLDAAVACVGDGAGLEFVSWLEQADLPDPDDVLADPTSICLPMRGDLAHAVLGAVVGSACDDSFDRWEASWRVLAQFARNGHLDVATVFARKLGQRHRPDWQLPEEIDVFADIVTAAGWS